MTVCPFVLLERLDGTASSSSRLTPQKAFSEWKSLGLLPAKRSSIVGFSYRSLATEEFSLRVEELVACGGSAVRRP